MSTADVDITISGTSTVSETYRRLVIAASPAAKSVIEAIEAERDAARADLARFRAALTDPAAVEAMQRTRNEHYVDSAGLRVVNCHCGQQLPSRDEFQRHQAAAALRAFAAFVDEEADRG